MILKDNSKILVSDSGEILKTPTIIDISSDYGVTKDGSNFVSKVKNRYAPNMWIADIGQEPIENGDGFDFTAGDKKLHGIGIDYTNPFIIEFWYKPITNSSDQRLLAQWNFPIDSTGYIFLKQDLNNLVSLNSSGLTKTSKYTDVSYSPSLGSWHHFIMNFDGVAYSDFVDGKTHAIWEYVSHTAKYTAKMFIGNMQGYSGSPFNGNMNSVKVVNFSNEKYNAYGGAVIKPDYVGQAFTPPTYPNTLL